MSTWSFLPLTLALLGCAACSGSCSETPDAPGSEDTQDEQAGLDLPAATIGTLTSVGREDDSVRTFFRYDARGRAVRTVQVREGQAFASTARYGYPGGEVPGTGSVLRESTFPRRTADSPETVRTTYSRSGEPLAIATTVAGSAEQAIYAGADYNARDEAVAVRHGNGVVAEYGYDESTLRPSSRVARDNDGQGAIRQSLSYTYDGAGNPTVVRDHCSVAGACCDPRVGSCAAGELSATYAYDVLGRIATYTPQGQPTLHYEYDALDNILVKESNVAPTEDPDIATKRYQYDPGRPKFLTSAPVAGKVYTYSYDGAGNLKERTAGSQVISVAYNGLNLPVRTTRTEGDASTVLSEKSYLDDDLVERVVRTAEGTKTTTLYLSPIAAEGDARRTAHFLPAMRLERVEPAGGAAEETVRKYYGGFAQRESRADGSDTRLVFALDDHLGSSSTVLDARAGDGSAAVVHRAAYKPFGSLLEGSDGQPLFSSSNVYDEKYGYNRKELETADPDFAVLDYGPRVYDPALGRWLQADTYHDGVNPFAYVHNSPIRFNDPSGHIKGESLEIQVGGHDTDLNKGVHLNILDKHGSRIGELWLTANEKHNGVVVRKITGHLGERISEENAAQLLGKWLENKDNLVSISGEASKVQAGAGQYDSKKRGAVAVYKGGHHARIAGVAAREMLAKGFPKHLREVAGPRGGPFIPRGARTQRALGAPGVFEAVRYGYLRLFGYSHNEAMDTVGIPRGFDGNDREDWKKCYQANRCI